MQKASDPLYFAEDSLLYQLRAPMNWPEQGEFIAEHICAGREEVLRANPHAWCDIVATNVQQDKEFQVYPEASFSEVVKLLENVPLATIQEHFQGNPDFDIAKYLQECGRAIQHKFIDAFFEMDVEQAQQKEGIGDFIRQHVSAGMNELAQSQDIEDRFQ